MIGVVVAFVSVRGCPWWPFRCVSRSRPVSRRCRVFRSCRWGTPRCLFLLLLLLLLLLLRLPVLVPVPVVVRAGSVGVSPVSVLAVVTLPVWARGV